MFIVLTHGYKYNLKLAIPCKGLEKKVRGCHYSTGSVINAHRDRL